MTDTDSFYHLRSPSHIQMGTAVLKNVMEDTGSQALQSPGACGISCTLLIFCMSTCTWCEISTENNWITEILVSCLHIWMNKSSTEIPKHTRRMYPAFCDVLLCTCRGKYNVTPPYSQTLAALFVCTKYNVGIQAIHLHLMPLMLCTQLL